MIAEVPFTSSSVCERCGSSVPSDNLELHRLRCVGQVLNGSGATVSTGLEHFFPGHPIHSNTHPAADFSGSRGTAAWVCVDCTLENVASAVACDACGRPRNGSRQGGHGYANPTGTGPWPCEACTFRNMPNDTCCAMCGAPKRAGQVPPMAIPTPDQRFDRDVVPSMLGAVGGALAGGALGWALGDRTSRASAGALGATAGATVGAMMGPVLLQDGPRVASPSPSPATSVGAAMQRSHDYSMSQAEDRDTFNAIRHQVFGDDMRRGRMPLHGDPVHRSRHRDVAPYMMRHQGFAPHAVHHGDLGLHGFPEEVFGIRNFDEGILGEQRPRRIVLPELDEQLMQQLVEHMSANEEPRWQPAREGAIDALPTQLVGTMDSDATSDACRSCAICMEDFKDGDVQRTLPCFHRFHRGCVDQWLHQQGTCPVCKHRVDNGET